MTLGNFITREFASTGIVATLRQCGFEPETNTKIIVAWDWEKCAELKAAENKIVLWKFAMIMGEIARLTEGTRAYFTDDTLNLIRFRGRVVK